MAETRIVQSLRLMLALMLAIALSLASVVTVSATHQQDDDQDQRQQNQQQGEQVQLNELLRNTDEFTGQDVTVSGPVGDEISRNTFTLTSDGSEILVVGDRQAIPRNLPQQVQVSGAVEEAFNISQVEDQLGVTLNDNALSQFEGEAFIMADQVQQAQRQGQQGQQQEQAEQVSLQELTGNARQFDQHRVEVSGNLQETPMPAIYMLSDQNDQVFVIADPNNVPSNLQNQNQDSLTVTGTAYRVTSRAFSNTFGLNLRQSQTQNMFPIVVIVADQLGGGQDQEGRQGRQGQQVQLRELLRNTDEFTGQDVTVTGPVGDEINRTAFTLSRGGNQILVVGDRQTIPSNLPDEVQVSGMVNESFQVSEVEDQLGVNLNQNTFSEFEGQPFIIADQVGDATDNQNNENQNQQDTDQD